MKYKITFITLLGFLFITSCNNERLVVRTTPPSIDQNRPHNPWVFRSVLDQKPRMLTLALHKDLWVSYDTQTGAMYKAWKGGVNLDGAVYTTSHGPQPSTLGDAYFINAYNQPWSIIKNGLKVDSKLDYFGHFFKNDRAYLHYHITIDENSTFSIYESPEYILSASGTIGLERTFELDGLPDGYQVLFNSNYNSVFSSEGIRTTAPIKFQEKEDGIHSELLLEEEETKLRILFSGEPQVISSNKVVRNDQPEGLQLINKNDCRSCHNEVVKTVGPSYRSIAIRYNDTDENRNWLKQKISQGGSGVWGGSVMSAHPDISDVELNEMVAYIMALDAEQEAERKASLDREATIEGDYIQALETIDESTLIAGAYLRAYTYQEDLYSLKKIDFSKEPDAAGVVPYIDLAGDQFGPYQEKFAVAAEGYLYIEHPGQYVLQLASDDGSSLTLHDSLIVDNDGQHGTETKEAVVLLNAGYHPFRIEYFENGGGQTLFFRWQTPQSGESYIVPASVIYHRENENSNNSDVFKLGKKLPGDRQPLTSVHPSYDLSQARPDDLLCKVGGLDFMPDGRLVISTWDAEGAVYIIDGVQSGDPSKMKAKKIASGLAEPLGLRVVDGNIYVMQKQEMTKLVDVDNDDYIDVYQVLCNQWDVTANFHEFGFGLAYKDDHFYATLATGILPGGASAPNQPKHRGNVIKVSKHDGSIEFLAHGLRTPNGIGIGVDKEIFVADNEGDWLPSSKIVHVAKGDWYGSRSVDFEGTEGMKMKNPVVWLPQNEIGNSPSTPTYINDGPYKGQMIHGEVTHGGVKRVFVEKVNGQYQGCVFRFIQGLEAGVNRLEWGPDGALYIGGIGSTGNWQQDRKLWYGLQRLQYNEASTFEMLSVSVRSNGMEITFTEPLPEGKGWESSEYEVKQWYYLPTENYGGPKMDENRLKVVSANVSEDRKSVFLEIEGMQPNHVIYIRLMGNPVSGLGNELWSTEAWYTLNHIPKNLLGEKREAIKIEPNTLTEEEQKAGWQLLFDGNSTAGWRNFKSETIGSSWTVKEGALTLDVERQKEGGTKAKDGGDIITDQQFENFELRLDWKISRCGNSGIMYNVQEAEEYCCVWQTGPEMQILDNTCHPDAKYTTHRAGDLYDMISCAYETVRPAGEWNEVRILVNRGKVEHWLNGRKLVSFRMFDKQWADMIANSKFKEMKGFGQFRKGHISLQDHNDGVAFRNIKIKRL